MGAYLFLCEAYLDFPEKYEPPYGTRVLPFFEAIGRNLDLILGAAGAETRARRLMKDGYRAPDGPLFELVVAAGYVRDGWITKFIEEYGAPHLLDRYSNKISYVRS